MAPGTHRSSNAGPSAGAAAIYAACLAAAWVWLVAGVHLHEMIVGAATVVVATLFLRLVHQSRPSVVDFSWKDVAQGWRIPGYLVQDVWLVAAAFLKDLLRVQPAGSYYRVCGFKGNGRDPRVVARSVLATLYATCTPNFIMVGVDLQSGKMLFHQVERTSLSEMVRALGAEP
jgi:hypothetical protein